jgi:hypothetical protein
VALNLPRPPRQNTTLGRAFDNPDGKVRFLVYFLRMLATVY